jgi:hypothetical protein
MANRGFRTPDFAQAVEKNMGIIALKALALIGLVADTRPLFRQEG